MFEPPERLLGLGAVRAPTLRRRRGVSTASHHRWLTRTSTFGVERRSFRRVPLQDWLWSSTLADRCTLLWVAPCAYANTAEFSQFSFYLKASHKRIGAISAYFAKEPNGVRLRRATAGEAQDAAASGIRNTCTVRPTRPAKGVGAAATPSATAGMEGLRAMADEEEPYELWDVDGGHAAADPAKLGVQTRTTLRPSCVIGV